MSRPISIEESNFRTSHFNGVIHKHVLTSLYNIANYEKYDFKEQNVNQPEDKRYTSNTTPH